MAGSNFIIVSKTPHTHFIGTAKACEYYFYIYRYVTHSLTRSTFQCWTLIIKWMIWLRCSCRQPIFEAHSTNHCWRRPEYTNSERERESEWMSKTSITNQLFYTHTHTQRKYKGKSNSSNNNNSGRSNGSNSSSSNDWNIHIVNNSATSSKSRNKNK